MSSDLYPNIPTILYYPKYPINGHFCAVSATSSRTISFKFELNWSDELSVHRHNFIELIQNVTSYKSILMINAHTRTVIELKYYN